MTQESQKHPRGVLLTVKVVPGSSRTQLAGRHGGMLKVKIAAPPEKGKANRMLQDFLAEQLHIKRNNIEIQSGQTSCVKQLLIQGVSDNDIQALFSD